MLDVHTIADFGASALLFLRLNAAATICRERFCVLDLTLIFAIVLRCLIIFIELTILFQVLAIAFRYVGVTFLQALAFAFTPPYQAMLFLLTISEHDYVALEFTVLLDCFEQLDRKNEVKMAASTIYSSNLTYAVEGDFKLREDILLEVLLGGEFVDAGR